jgi:HSP20 family molecular chaperone IbpA
MLFQNFYDLDRALSFLDREMSLAKPRRFSPSGYNTGNEYVIKMELPGFSSDNIKISSENQVLNISGSRERNSQEKLVGYEKSVEFDSSYVIPEGFDVNATSAELVNGVLWLTVPREEREIRRIEIKNGTSTKELKGENATSS